MRGLNLENFVDAEWVDYEENIGDEMAACIKEWQMMVQNRWNVQQPQNQRWKDPQKDMHDQSNNSMGLS